MPVSKTLEFRDDKSINIELTCWQMLNHKCIAKDLTGTLFASMKFYEQHSISRMPFIHVLHVCRPLC